MDEPEDSSDATTETPTTTPVRQIAVFLPNRAGALLSILTLLKANHVVVLGLSVQDSVDATVVRLVVSDPDTVEPLFMEKGIPYSTCELIVVELGEGPEQMPECLRELLNAETNIHFIYPLLTQPKGKSAVAICMEDNDFGKAVLSKSGYRILEQDDLSR